MLCSITEPQKVTHDRCRTVLVLVFVVGLFWCECELRGLAWYWGRKVL